MCGIMGYVGPRPAAPILIGGLRRLEYRGYDSAGVAVSNGAVEVVKAAGKLDVLAGKLDEAPLAGTTGIGHTRWATHGPPNDANAHPHCDPGGTVAVVHNGIIENFLDLREELAGAHFASDTDTEVMAHLVAQEYDGDLVAAVRRAVDRAEGAYALVVMSAHEPQRLVAVRKISPLVVGLGDGETYLASDIPALLDHTRDVLIVEDGELVVIDTDGARIETLDGEPVTREPWRVDWEIRQAEKAGYEHFMLKEIFEEPTAIADTLAGQLGSDGSVTFDLVDLPAGLPGRLDRIWVTGCGTAYHAGLAGKEVFQSLLRLPVELAYAHEMRYSDPVIDERSLTVAISQSGETVDTLVAGRLAASRGSRLLALTNVVGSTISREAHDVVYTRAGPEIAVASTKAYVSQLIGLYLLALYLGAERGSITPAAARSMAGRLEGLPGIVQQVLKHEDAIEEIAADLVAHDDIYFIGRGLDYAVATEGSLKLKEISYQHSEAMPAGELKHGTLALVTHGTPVVAVITQGRVRDKTLSAVQEVKARGAQVIAVAWDDDADIGKLADHVLGIPRTDDLFAPVPAIVPLQLLAYHVARQRGNDIDQPRNLAKSVTVE